MFNQISGLIDALAILPAGGITGIGVFYFALYFMREQRETAIAAYGLTGMMAGLRLSLFLFSHIYQLAGALYDTLYASLFLFSSWLVLISLIVLKPSEKSGRLVFLSGCAAAASTIAVLGSLPQKVKIFLLLVNCMVLISLGGFHLSALFRKGERPAAPLVVYLLSALSHVSFFYFLYRGYMIFPLWEILFALSVGTLLIFEARDIALYFSEVEDLSYSLKVTNASLQKSEDLIKRKNDQLHHQASHDYLTQLPNRMSLYHMTNTTLQNHYRKNHKVGFLLLDLDRFKQLNDTMGHKIGDQLLIQFARRIRSTLRNTDQLYRLGGDEFTIIVNEIHRIEDLNAIVSKIYTALDEPIGLGNIKYKVSSSIGVSLFPDHGKDIDTLLGKADLALYVAKEEGRNRAVFFKENMQGKSDEYFSLRKRLSDALEKNEFCLFFQPQYVFGSDGEIFGFEALVRLGDGEGGQIPPSLFIPIAEDSGFILPLGNWILNRACHITRNWVALNPDLKISVNISASHFRAEGFISDLVSILERNDFPPANLVLELTENLALNRDDRTYRLIHRIRDMGVEIAIDDFGTGFSSLNYLKEFPLDHIKIDKSFIDDIPHSKPDKAIVRSIIEMAASLNMKVIAEGVEREDQYQYLWDRGCQIVQGYLTGMPLPEDEAARLYCKRCCPVGVNEEVRK